MHPTLRVVNRKSSSCLRGFRIHAASPLVAWPWFYGSMARPNTLAATRPVEPLFSTSAPLLRLDTAGGLPNRTAINLTNRLQAFVVSTSNRLWSDRWVVLR